MCTVRPFHSMSRGSPTFTDSSRAIVCSLYACLPTVAGDVEVAIRAVRNHCLTRLKMELGAVELYRDNVRFERDQIGDAADLRIGVTIRPCPQTCVTDVVVTAQALCTGRRSGVPPGSAQTHQCLREERTNAERSRTRRGLPVAWYRR